MEKFIDLFYLGFIYASIFAHSIRCESQLSSGKIKLDYIKSPKIVLQN